MLKLKSSFATSVQIQHLKVNEKGRLSIVNDTQPSEPILLKTAAICKATCDKEASH